MLRSLPSSLLRRPPNAALCASEADGLASSRKIVAHYSGFLTAGLISCAAAVLAAKAVSIDFLSPTVALAVVTLVTSLLFLAGAVRQRHKMENRASSRDREVAALTENEARLQLAQGAAGIASIVFDMKGDNLIWSSNFEAIFGTNGDVAPPKSACDWFKSRAHPHDKARVEALFTRLVQQGGEFSDDFRIVSESGVIRWICARGAVLRDDADKPARIVASCFDVTDRRRNERKLERSLAMFELANDAGEIGVWTRDLAVPDSAWDHRARRIFGLNGDEDRIDLAAVEQAIHPDDRVRVKAVLVEAAKDGKKFSFECRIRRADGVVRWVCVSGLADVDPSSRRAVSMTGIVFDVTERREREAHLQYVMRELTHRSKNLLAVIQGMARQTGGSAVSLNDFQTRFAARLQGMAASHDLLVSEDWRGAFLKEIVQAQVMQLKDLGGARITAIGPNVLLKPEAAQNIGLALHELSTNAAKFGAFANAGGRVSISWSVDMGSDGTFRLKLVWQESGGPPVAAPGRGGFGSNLIERLVARALDGEVKLTYLPDGLVWILVVPASWIVTAATLPPAMASGSAIS